MTPPNATNRTPVRSGYWWLRRELREWFLAGVRAVPGRIGQSLRRAVYRRMLAACGDGCVFLEHVVFTCPQRIRVGSRAAISRGVQFQGAGGIDVGDDVLMGPGVKVWSINHQFDDPRRTIAAQGFTEAPVVIEDDVWLGANVVVLPGSRIGRGSVVAAGSVVRGTVPPMVLAAGSPATVRRPRGEQPAGEVSP